MYACVWSEVNACYADYVTMQCEQELTTLQDSVFSITTALDKQRT